MVDVIDDLRNKNKELALLILKREVADVQAKEAQREQERKQAQARADAAGATADAEAAEKTREGAWLTYALDEQVRKGGGGAPFDFAGARSNIPKTGWPPGRDAAFYGIGPAAKHVPDDVAETAMYKLAKKFGVKF